MSIGPGQVHTARIERVTSEDRFPGNNWAIWQSWLDAEHRRYGFSTLVYRATWREAMDFAFAHARGEKPSRLTEYVRGQDDHATQ